MASLLLLILTGYHQEKDLRLLTDLLLLDQILDHRLVEDHLPVEVTVHHLQEANRRENHQLAEVIRQILMTPGTKELR